ncbi:MAG: hypothetical protein ACRD2G_06770 [Terriglobia bacterium]
MGLLIAVVLLLPPLCVEAQNTVFNSGSDGSDGALDYSSVAAGTTVYFDPAALGLKGSQDQLCVFNFTTITIPIGVTVKLSANKLNCPIYWLASGDVAIAGTLDLSGAPGGNSTTDTAVRVPATPGSGGYSGGVGGNTSTSQAATTGNGPGGGAASAANCSSQALGGTFTGNAFSVPMVGGSGGGGQNTGGQFGAGGGAGGGAILIASSTQIIVNGTINANGGSGGNPVGCYPGGGSGGAVRLVSNTIGGSGRVEALGSGSIPGSAGGLRLEANTFSFTGSAVPTPGESNPLALELPSIPPASVVVTSVGGTAISENPFSFPDITINNSSSISVVITAHQVPAGTVPTLYVFSEKGDQTLPCTGGLQGSLTTSTCTISIPFPYGGSRGFVKATW